MLVTPFSNYFFFRKEGELGERAQKGIQREFNETEGRDGNSVRVGYLSRIFQVPEPKSLKFHYLNPNHPKIYSGIQIPIRGIPFRIQLPEKTQKIRRNFFVSYFFFSILDSIYS